MATAQSFEELDCWKEARAVTSRIYGLTREPDFSRDFGLKDQIRRGAVGVMSNIAEGFEREGASEFHNFLSIAKGSAGEVRAQLYIALDQGYINQSSFDELAERTRRVSRLMRRLMRYLSNTDRTGTKFREAATDTSDSNHVTQADRKPQP